MMNIGVTCNIYEEKQVQSLSRHYTQCLQEVGALPLLLGAIHREQAERAADLLDGLLLSGGGDVSPALYGEQPHEKLGEVTPSRDEAELLLTQAFLQRGKPIFGICRGVQVLAVALGGTLWQDLPSQLNPKDDHNDGWHDIMIMPDTILHQLYGDKLHINTLHHQAIKDTGPRLRVSARTPDHQVIEAVEGVDIPVWGVQWHPERMWGLDGRTEMQALFERFVSQCRSHAMQR